MANTQSSNTKVTPKSTTQSKNQTTVVTSKNGADQWDEQEDYQVEAWWAPEIGGIQGHVVDAFKARTKKGQVRVVYVIRTTAPGKFTAKDAGKKDPPEEFPAGAIVGASERAIMAKKLAPKVKLLANVEVRLEPIEIVDLKEGQTMWRMKIATRGGTPRTTPLVIPAPALPRDEDEGYESDSGEEDIPF